MDCKSDTITTFCFSYTTPSWYFSQRYVEGRQWSEKAAPRTKLFVSTVNGLTASELNCNIARCFCQTVRIVSVGKWEQWKRVIWVSTAQNTYRFPIIYRISKLSVKFFRVKWQLIPLMLCFYSVFSVFSNPAHGVKLSHIYRHRPVGLIVLLFSLFDRYLGS